MDENTILTVELREIMMDVLLNAIESNATPGRAAHTGYLDRLDATPVGSPLGGLVDVVEYFGLTEADA